MEGTDDDYYCAQCDSNVFGNSKHCRTCDRFNAIYILRCVKNFDHHCKWLNNCIGEGNYTYFFRLIVSVAAFASIYIACAIAVLVGGVELALPYMLWSWCCVGCTGVLFFLDSNLILFHLYLQQN
jgi:palmitoyltransferase